MTLDEIESALYRYWVCLPEPKIDYTQWYYSDGGIREMILNYHKPDPTYEDRFLLKPKLRMGGTNAK